MKGIGEKPLVMVDTDDFEDIHRKYLVEQVHLKVQFEEEQVGDEMEEQAKVISEWTGLEEEKVVKMMKTVESDFSLASKLNGLIKEEQKKVEEERKKK